MGKVFKTYYNEILWISNAFLLVVACIDIQCLTMKFGGRHWHLMSYIEGQLDNHFYKHFGSMIARFGTQRIILDGLKILEKKNSNVKGSNSKHNIKSQCFTRKYQISTQR